MEYRYAADIYELREKNPQLLGTYSLQPNLERIISVGFINYALRVNTNAQQPYLSVSRANKADKIGLEFIESPQPVFSPTNSALSQNGEFIIARRWKAN